MILTYSLLVIGFVALLFGADILVAGASSLARRLNISEAVIGLTIVAFGTSMPEFVVNISAAIEGSGDIALANVVGSNVFNVLAILGCSALVVPLAVDRDRRVIDIPIAILSAMVLLFLSQDYLLCYPTQFLNALLSPNLVSFINPDSSLSSIDGLVLLAIFASYMFYIVHSTLKNRNNNCTAEESKANSSYFFLFLKIVGGLVLLVLGGRIIVSSAVKIAESLGVTQRVIGLTIVSIGTSLPELATSVVAAFRRQADIAVTNIVGSNIFNALFILGATAVVRPVVVTPYSLLDLVLNLVVSLAIFFIALGRNHHIGRISAICMLIVYVFYVYYLI